MQAELISNRQTYEWSNVILLFAGNQSVLVISDIPQITDKNETILSFGVGSISYFRPVLDSQHWLHAFILRTGGKNETQRWYLAKIETDTDGWGDTVLVVGDVLNLTSIFQKDVLSITDVHYYLNDGDGEIQYLVSKAMKDGSFQIDFLHLSEQSFSTFSQVDIRCEKLPCNDNSAMTLVPFIQGGKVNRSLIALHDQSIIHVIAPPVYNSSSSETTNYLLDWLDANAKTVVMKTEDPADRLIHVSLFNEGALRWGNNAFYVWLAYVVDKGPQGGPVTSEFKMKLFPEFGIRWSPEDPSPSPTADSPSEEHNPQVPGDNAPSHSSIPGDMESPEAIKEPSIANTPSGSVESPDNSTSSPPPETPIEPPRNPWSASLVSVLNPFGFVNDPCPWNKMMNSTTTGTCSDARYTRVVEHVANGNGIRQIEIRSIPAVEWLENFLPPGISLRHWATPAITIMFAIESTRLHIYAMDPKWGSELEIRLEEINKFEMMGIGHRLVVSRNGLHALPIVEKYRWELESINRYNDICEKLADKKNLNSFELQVRRLWFSSSFFFSIQRFFFALILTETRSNFPFQTLFF